MDGLLIFNALFDYGVWTAQSEIARHGAEGSEDLGGDDYFGAAPRDDAISEDNVRTYAEYHKYVWALWKVLSVLFCGVYVAECAAKLYVMDLKKYYASYGNVFDFLLTAATVLGTTFSLISDDGPTRPSEPDGGRNIPPTLARRRSGRLPERRGAAPSDI